jgi:hypothetical protein
MIKKTRKFEGLSELPSYIEDVTPLSPNYFDITFLPKTLHAGKNLIRLKGNDNNLKIGTALYIEILDFNGDPIYYEVANFLYEDKSRVISIWIYEDTPPGEATITILGQTDEDLDGNPVPPEWKDVPNVKWSSVFSVDLTKRNDSEIIFEDDNQPEVSIDEKIRPYLVREFETSQFVTQSAGVVDYRLSGENATLTLSGNRFRQEHIGAWVKVTPNNATPTININVDDTTYWSKIKSVKTTSSAVLDTKYFLEADDSNYTYTAKTMTSCSYEIHYQALPVYVDTQNLRSLGYIQVNNIEPATGEAYRAKTFIRSKGSSAAWELVDDTVLKESDFLDILIDTGSIDVKTRIGVFEDQQTIDAYWKSELTQRQNGSVIIDPPTFVSNQTLTYDSGSKMLNSMHITSNTATTYPEQFVKVYASGSTGKTVKTFEQNGQYDLTLNALGVRSTILGSGQTPYIEFYLSGSAFANKVNETGLGKKIGEIDVSKISPGTNANTFRFDEKTFTVTADEAGNGLLIMKVNAGEWYISDLSLKPSTEFGFTPCQSTALIALPTEHINDQLDFKIEYYDYQGQQSKFISYCDSCDFEGGNYYIGGEKNLLTGSLFVGNGTGSGVEINGVAGGFVRSIGYDGFDLATAGTGSGFVIWSGSYFSSYNSEDYNGVGLELHAGGGEGSLKFRTHPTPVFEVITPAFFFGNPNGAFISGSNGNIQISSSFFQLNPTGEITASAGVIGGWEITDKSLYSEGTATSDEFVGMITASEATSVVFFAGADNNDPDPSNPTWHVKNNGQMTGSGVQVLQGSSVMFDTSNAFLDAENIARNLYIDTLDTIHTFSYSSPGPPTSGSVVSFLATLLPKETKLTCYYKGWCDDINARNVLKYEITPMTASNPGPSGGDFDVATHWDYSKTQTTYTPSNRTFGSGSASNARYAVPGVDVISLNSDVIEQVVRIDIWMDASVFSSGVNRTIKVRDVVVVSGREISSDANNNQAVLYDSSGAGS